MPIYVDCQYGHMIDIDWKREYNEDGTHHMDIGAAIDIKIYTKWLADQRQAQWNNVAAMIDNILKVNAWYRESFVPFDTQTHPEVVAEHIHDMCYIHIENNIELLGLSISED